MTSKLACLAGDDARSGAGEYIRIELDLIQNWDRGWIGRVFGVSRCKEPVVVGKTNMNEPIFYVPVPHAVLREIVHMLRVGDKSNYNVLPCALREKMTVRMWSSYCYLFFDK